MLYITVLIIFLFLNFKFVIIFNKKNLNKYGKYIEKLEKEVAILKKDSHPPIFGKSDLKKIEKRLKKLEKEK